MSRVALQPWFELPPGQSPHPPRDLAPQAVTTGVDGGADRSSSASWRWAFFLAPLLVYLAGGAWLVFVGETLMSDALSRVGNAYYVLFSRDPHLAAVGFVWSPLPSLAELPLLPIRYIWPAFVTTGFVAAVQSAVFMAGAVYQMRRYLEELGLSQGLALVTTLVFACNPVIAYYGMNGMSEASFLFFMIAATRYLSRWLTTEQPSALALSGSALGLAYLCRYEAAAAGLAAMALVAVITYLRPRPMSAHDERRSATVANTLLVALPFLFAFAGWAVASWLIIGSPFAQFTSEYGNSAQTRLSADSIASLAQPHGISGLARYMIDQWRALAPLGIVVAVVCGVVAFRRRDLRPSVPIVLLGSSLAFSVMAFLAGQTFGWLRFSIALIPLVVLLAASAIANITTGPARPWRLPWPSRDRASVHVPRMVGGVAVLALVAAGLPRAASALLDPYLGREESYFLTAVLRPEDASEEQRGAVRRLAGDREVAAFLDALNLPEGAVLVDSADGFGIILSSTTPRQFTITADRDFSDVLRDPQGEGVQYLLSRPRAFASADAITRAHPGLFEGTSDVARLERVFVGSGGDLEPWHLFSVLPGG